MRMKMRVGKTGWILMAVVVAMAASGCRRTRGPRGDRDADGLGLDPGFEVIDIGMGGERFGYGDEERGRFDIVYFGLDNSSIDSSERAKVEQVADYLRRNPRVSILIEGHCCKRGSAEYNLALGERRALAVRAYLVGLGVDPDRIQTVSYGEERPAVDGDGEHILRQNRRAEFVIVR